MDNTFKKLGICKFKELPVNDFFSYDGEIFLKLSDYLAARNSFNVKTLERTSVSDADAEVEHLKLKSKNTVLLKVTYSWGDAEPDQEFDSFEHAWEKALLMASKEAETDCQEHGKEVGLRFNSRKTLRYGYILLHYSDGTYCRYSVYPEVADIPGCDEYHSGEELSDELKFWSNGCGELHYHGKHNVTEDELPDPLKEAYHNLWNENAGYLEYLVEYKGSYYVAIEAEYDSKDCNSAELFAESCLNAKEYILSYEKKGCKLVIGHGTGPEEADNELYFLIPALISKEEFECIEDILTEYIFEGNRIPVPVKETSRSEDTENMLEDYNVTLHETYEATYEIQAHSPKEAEELLREKIQEGLEDGPEECSNSWCEVKKSKSEE